MRTATDNSVRFAVFEILPVQRIAGAIGQNAERRNSL